MGADEFDPAERERELAALEALLRRALGGSGGAALVEGPAGAGKTALLAASARRARAAGATVLHARAAEDEREFPFGVALSLLGAKNAPPDGDGALHQGIQRLHEATAELAAQQPLVFVIDDLQWADVPSLRWLLYLSNRIEDLPLALIAALEPAAPLPPPLAELRARPGVALVRPEPLSAAGVAQVLRRALGGVEPQARFAAACAELSGGNPGLAHELAAAAADEGIEPIDSEEQRLRELSPPALRRRGDARLMQLGPAAAAFARALAVAGEPTPPFKVAQLAGLDDRDASQASDALVAAEIVAGEQRVAFANALVRRAVYDAVAPHERARMHRRLATMLQDEGARREDVATHLLKAEPAGEPWAVDCLREAARRATARGAPATAASYLARALDEPPAGAQRAALLRELAEAEAACGDPRAFERLEHALELTAEPAERATILIAQGRLLYVIGDGRGAARCFSAAVDAAGGVDDGLAAEARAALAGTRVIARAPGSADAGALRELLEAVGDDPTPAQRTLLAQTALIAGMSLTIDHEEALALCERALGGTALVEQETADGMSLYSVTGVLYGCDAFARELEVLDAAIADAERRGSALGLATALYVRGSALYGMGALDEALAAVTAALDGSGPGWELYEPAARHLLALIQIERDELDAAERAIGSGIERIESIARNMLLRTRGMLRSEQGRWEEALADLRAAGEHPAFGAYVGPGSWRPPAAVAAAKLGRREEALALCEEELANARRWGTARVIGDALRAQGVVVGGSDGLELLHEAVAVLEESPSALTRAGALLDLGSALRRAGLRRKARAALQRAATEAGRAGAARIERLARAELAIVSGSEAPARDAHGLTPSERRIADMAASGMGNREIAGALFVTVKAVEKHLAAVYRKLEIGSRRELAAALGDPAGTSAAAAAGHQT